MASWGLLRGIGRGLSDSAQMIGQGMAADRQAELDRLREESIERRWRAQQDTAKANRAEDVAFRESQATTSANQFDKQMSLRDKQAIESNLNAVMEQQARAEEKIRSAYQKRMETMGASPELEAQMQADMEANQMYYSERLHNMISSYGDAIKGTGFEYLLNTSDPQPEPAISSEPEANQSNNNDDKKGLFDLIMDNSGSQVPGNVSTQTVTKQQPELTFSNLLRKWQESARVQPGTTTQEQQDRLSQLKNSGVRSAYGINR